MGALSEVWVVKVGCSSRMKRDWYVWGGRGMVRKWKRDKWQCG